MVGKKQDNRWSDMHLQDCRQNEKMCDPCWIDKLRKNKTSFLSLLQLCTTHVGAIDSLDTTINP